MEAGRPTMEQVRENGHRSLKQPEERPRVAAFFDFDKTLLHGDAGVIFGRTLAGYGYEQRHQYDTFAKQSGWVVFVTGKLVVIVLGEVFFRALYKIGVLKRSKLVELAYRFMKGLPASEMYERMAHVWETMLKDRMYEPMLDVIRQHKSQGHKVVIVTTGLKPLVEHAKAVLGKDVDVIGCEMGVLEDLFTGIVEGPLYGVHKAQAIAKYAAESGLDLSRSFAYSDHYSDAAFLEAVGNPVVVNPKRRLRRLAQTRGWRIIRVSRPVSHAAATAASSTGAPGGAPRPA